jgi:gamma-glutamylcysteine synthetase
MGVKGNVNHRQIRKDRFMAESRDMRKQIEHLVERSQREIVEASRNLASGISKGTERLVTPISNDIERMMDDVFDFAERVVNSQRRMVSDVVKAINEQADRAVDAGRTASRRIIKRAPAKKAAAKKAPAKKAAAKKAPAKKAAAKKAPAKKAEGSGEGTVAFGRATRREASDGPKILY